MRFLLLIAIVVGTMLFSLHTAAFAGKIDNRVFTGIDKAAAEAAPLLSSPRFTLLMASNVITANKHLANTMADEKGTPITLHDVVANEINAASKLPQPEKRQLPKYMHDINDLRYDVTRYPLHVAVATGDYPKAELLLKEKNLDVLALLLLEGAAFDIAHKKAAIPIHMAATQNFIEALVMLQTQHVGQLKLLRARGARFAKARELGLAHLFTPWLKNIEIPKDVAKVIEREKIINNTQQEEK